MGMKKDTQINGTEKSTETNSHIYGQLLYGKQAKNIQWGEDSLFDKRCCKNWTQHTNNETGALSHPRTKMNSKWIKDLIIRPRTIKFLEANI